AEDGIRDKLVTGVQTCALPIYRLLRRAVDRDAEPVEQGPVAPEAAGFLGAPGPVEFQSGVPDHAVERVLVVAREAGAQLLLLEEIGRASGRGSVWVVAGV